MIHIKQVCSRLVFLSTLLALSSVNAETNKINIDKNQFHESFSENVKISGSVRAGVMYSSLSKHVTPDLLYIDIGATSNQMLCVKILSMDGQYSAKFQYQLTGNRSGLVPFQLPTAYHDVVASYSPDQLAVLAEIKSDCKKKGGYIVPALWGKLKLKPETEREPDVVEVFLNSGIGVTYLKLYYKNEGNISEPLTCGPVDAERNTAYDTKCDITNASQYDLERTKIIRTNLGNYSRPVKLPIRMPKN